MEKAQGGLRSCRKPQDDQRGDAKAYRKHRVHHRFAKVAQSPIVHLKGLDIGRTSIFPRLDCFSQFRLCEGCFGHNYAAPLQSPVTVPTFLGGKADPSAVAGSEEAAVDGE